MVQDAGDVLKKGLNQKAARLQIAANGHHNAPYFR